MHTRLTSCVISLDGEATGNQIGDLSNLVHLHICGICQRQALTVRNAE